MARQLLYETTGHTSWPLEGQPSPTWNLLVCDRFNTLDGESIKPVR